MRPLTTLATWAALLAFSGLFGWGCLTLAVPDCEAFYETAGRSQAELREAYAAGDDFVGYDETLECWYVD